MTNDTYTLERVHNGGKVRHQYREEVFEDPPHGHETEDWARAESLSRALNHAFSVFLYPHSELELKTVFILEGGEE